jgi:eukaryotic-like serine/threonine-protein kinase
MLDSNSEAFHNVPDVSAEPPETPAADSLVGRVLAGRYRIERLVGSGGMGSVYRAEHVLMRKACAVKVLHPEMTQVKEVVARFEREAVAAARIENPHVVAATDFGELEDGSFYLVLELIDGQSLTQLIHDTGGLNEERALLIARQVGDALAAAHAASVVHRDLKPDNVMLVTKDGAADYVKVLDFGIAKVKLEESGAPTQQALTRLNTVMGTPEYMAPEQARGEAVDHRADLYTVGVILYEMLSGRSPFRHEDFVVVLTKKLTEAAPELPPTVSSGTRELVSALLQRSADARPQSAAEMLVRIDRILGYSPAPTNAAFAPLSAPRSRSSGAAAYASTVLGEAPAPLPRASLSARARVSLVPALALLRRPIQLGSRALPAGVLFGGLLVLPLLLALLLSVGSLGDGQRDAAKVPPAAPAERDLAELMQRSERGDLAALSELQARPAATESAAAQRALASGWFKVGQLEAGLRAYLGAARLEPTLGSSSDVIANLRKAAAAEPPVQELALEVAAALGEPGADLLYEVYDANRTVNAALSRRAKALLDSEAVQRGVSAALRIALELPKAKAEGCQAVKKLLPRVQESGDARAAPTLARLAERRGCGFLGLRDCFGCLRSSKDLANAQKAAGARPAP